MAQLEEAETESGIRSVGIINLILGAWLIITPYWFSYTSSAAIWNQVILGIVIVVFSGLRALLPTQRWLSIVSGIAGLWAIVAPFILSYNRSVAYWNEVIVGIIVAYLAFYNGSLSTSSRHHHSPA